MKIKSAPEVSIIFNNYPSSILPKMQNLRELILETAEETETIDTIEETLKWGEPSYITAHGSTIRMDWKKSKPDYYALYFQCTSKLIPTFKHVYPNSFTYEGNRAIRFSLNEKIKTADLKKCIQAALIYHKIKHLTLLGL